MSDVNRHAVILKGPEDCFHPSSRHTSVLQRSPDVAARDATACVTKSEELLQRRMRELLREFSSHR